MTAETDGVSEPGRLMALSSVYELASAERLRALIEPASLYGGPQNLDLLRLDKVHAELSGNKVFKLLGFLKEFEASADARALLSFGGPYSNHLHALAALGCLTGIPVILVVRGYEHLPLTPTLQDCRRWGAEIVFADKKTYAQRYDPDWQGRLACQYQALTIPEGGQGIAGERGCAAIASVCSGYDQIWLATGTGTTALGIARVLSEQAFTGELVGVHALADQGALARSWQTAMPETIRWRLIDDAHGGGFARVSADLLALIAGWDQRGLALDPVYTAKLMWALQRETAEEEAEETAMQPRRLMVHSGGLQGRRGVKALA